MNNMGALPAAQIRILLATLAHCKRVFLNPQLPPP
jgi:hypothetical protein